MRRLTILMTDEERTALDNLARQAYREPRAQLMLMLREELRRQGFLTGETGRTNEQHEGVRHAVAS